MQKMTAMLGKKSGDTLLNLWEEYEAGTSTEAKLLKQGEIELLLRTEMIPSSVRTFGIASHPPCGACRCRIVSNEDSFKGEDERVSRRTRGYAQRFHCRRGRHGHASSVKHWGEN
eukprot:359042-Prorocentrum_minimum.AAC.1